MSVTDSRPDVMTLQIKNLHLYQNTRVITKLGRCRNLINIKICSKYIKLRRVGRSIVSYLYLLLIKAYVVQLSKSRRVGIFEKYRVIHATVRLPSGTKSTKHSVISQPISFLVSLEAMILGHSYSYFCLCNDV